MQTLQAALDYGFDAMQGSVRLAKVQEPTHMAKCTFFAFPSVPYHVQFQVNQHACEEIKSLPTL